ncbi:MAG TPA: hypothetical protein VG500_14970, partial [Gemmatimonadales bacterium]|nr:hypothetical protein [Gemmatimonadales bacterium]
RAQSKDDDRWQIELDNGEYIWDIRLVRLAGDTLLFRQADTLGGVRVERITELRLIRKTEMRLGEGGGGAMAALTGVDDEIYDLAAMEFAARIRALQQVFLLHPPKP